MAYKTVITAHVEWVPDGGYQSFLGINQSNNPGYTNALSAGATGVAQSADIMVAELVPGGDAPTLANFLTAFTNAANDLAGTPPNGGTPLFSQPGALFGQAPATPLAIIQGWAQGNP